MIIIKKIKLYLKKNKFLFEKTLKAYQVFINLKIKLRYCFGTNKDIFTDIYLKNKWGDKDSYSGTGSNLDQTKKILLELPTIIRNYKIKNFLDIPCGDFYWMKEFDFRDLNYIGADIVSELVDKNIKNFKRSNLDFQRLDLLVDDLPESDLIFCRDCLVHFSFNDIFKAFKNIKKSNSKYLMTTNFTRRKINCDISTGSWRTINLCKPPFNFPEPSLTILENCTEHGYQYSDKALSLWEVSKITNFT